MADAAALCKEAMRLVASSGGRASRLMSAWGEAAMYLSASVDERRAMPSANWDAYHAVVAGDVPRPDRGV